MIAYLIAGVAALAMISGLAYKTYEAGADKVRTEWAEATLKAKSEAEAERQRQDALRQQQDKQVTRRLSDEKKRSQTLMASLEAHIKAARLPAECRLTPELLGDANAALAGSQGERPGTVPRQPTAPTHAR